LVSYVFSAFFASLRFNCPSERAWRRIVGLAAVGQRVATFAADNVVPLWQHGKEMSETANEFSLTREASSWPGGKKPNACESSVTRTLGAMNRRVLLIFVPLCLVIVAGPLLLFRLPGTPRLCLLGFTNAPSSNETVAVLCLKNSAKHRIYLNGQTNGATIYTCELATPAGWVPAEMPASPKRIHTWGLNPGERFVFSVPAMTNQQAAWRVAVRYFDGAQFTQIPVLWHILPGGGPCFPLPWKGSGRYYTVSTDILKQQQ
jgi:hypothetical protein